MLVQLKPTILRKVTTAALVAFVGIAGLRGYQLMRSEISSDIYRTRLKDLSNDYEQLRATYNTAIKKTAITELIVEDNQLNVVVRTDEGILKTIPTPFDPSEEIHVDYVVVNGRLWIRRIFTVPTTHDAVIIDPKLAEIEWDPDGREYGLTIYRPLSEGRWIVNTTTNGALTLVKQDQGGAPLSSPPAIREFDQIQRELTASVDEIGPGDVFHRLLRPQNP